MLEEDTTSLFNALAIALQARRGPLNLRIAEYLRVREGRHFRRESWFLRRGRSYRCSAAVERFRPIFDETRPRLVTKSPRIAAPLTRASQARSNFCRFQGRFEEPHWKKSRVACCVTCRFSASEHLWFRSLRMPATTHKLHWQSRITEDNAERNFWASSSSRLFRSEKYAILRTFFRNLCFRISPEIFGFPVKITMEECV